MQQEEFGGPGRVVEKEVGDENDIQHRQHQTDQRAREGDQKLLPRFLREAHQRRLAADDQQGDVPDLAAEGHRHQAVPQLMQGDREHQRDTGAKSGKRVAVVGDKDDRQNDQRTVQPDRNPENGTELIRRFKHAPYYIGFTGSESSEKWRRAATRSPFPVPFHLFTF